MARRLLLVFFAVAFVALESGWAIRLRPFLNLQEMNDDNIYLDDQTGTQSSMVTTITPGLDLILPVKMHVLTLTGFLDAISYANNPAKNDASNSAIKVNIDSSLGRNSKFNLYNINLNTSDPASSEDTQRVKRLQNTTFAKLSLMPITNFGLDVDYNSTNQEYQDPIYLTYNRTEVQSKLTFSYTLSKIALLLGMGAGYTNYESHTNDNNYSILELGLRRKVTARLVSELRFGQETRTYKYSVIVPPVLPVFSLQFSERFSQKTQVTVKGEKRVYESATYTNNPYFDSTAGIFELKQGLGDKLTLNAGVTYRMNDYPEPVLSGAVLVSRSDMLLDLEVGVSYKLQDWLNLKAGLRNRSRDSNANEWDYTDNQIQAGIDFAY
jgi:hypothetical protein